MRYTSKYKNKKTQSRDGIWHDSEREARRWEELLLLFKAGHIMDLKRQVKFVLIPTQRAEGIVGPKGGKYPGKVIERECYYKADFVYWDLRKAKMVVEDAKGVRTPEYIIKRKLMLYVHNIRVVEV